MKILAKAVGRRKEAVAQVQIKQGTGQFIINNKPAQEYLQNDFYSLLAVKAPFNVLSGYNHTANHTLAQLHDLNSVNTTEAPLTLLSSNFEPTTLTEASLVEANPQARDINLTENIMNLDTFVIVKGGGLRGQTEAIRLGISRALCLLSTNTNNLLVNHTTTTQDSLTEVQHHELVAGTLSNDLDIRKQLKDKGYLTQDSRVKERRKYGLKKARKASQYHKR